MENQEVLRMLARRPSVHLLCAGAYLQSVVELGDGHAYVPLTPLGSETPARWLATYAEHCGVSVDFAAVQTLIEHGASAFPCVAIVVPILIWVTAEEADLYAQVRLERYRELLSWATGNDVQPFGVVVLSPAREDAHFRLITPSFTGRRRLGFGNVGTDFVQSLKKIIECADRDEHFAFALSMLHDANAERNVRFKIARYFSCLEALSYRIKKGQGSRDAVRQLLGLQSGRTGQASAGGRTYDYDVVLGAGKLRDLLFHGVPVDFSMVKPNERDTFDLLENHPEIYVSDLQSRVEFEIQRWGNGKSNGQAVERTETEDPSPL